MPDDEQDRGITFRVDNNTRFVLSPLDGERVRQNIQEADNPPISNVLMPTDRQLETAVEGLRDGEDPDYRDPHSETFHPIEDFTWYTLEGEEIVRDMYIPVNGNLYQVMDRKGPWTRTDDGREFYVCMVEQVNGLGTDFRLVTYSLDREYWAIAER